MVNSPISGSSIDACLPCTVNTFKPHIHKYYIYIIFIFYGLELINPDGMENQSIREFGL